MVQRLFAFLLLLLMVSAPSALAADTKKPSSSTAHPAPHPQQNPDERFLHGRTCLQRGDASCVQVALAGINPASPYAKILEAQLAAVRSDSDTVLRLLIPLQAETGLLPQAYASLHATLAQAYASQENLLRAVEQQTLAEPFLDDPEAIRKNQTELWQRLAGQSRDTLIEFRGQSPDPIVQGWIDLALAHVDAMPGSRYIDLWRATYPDHPAEENLLRSISATITTSNTAKVSGKVALLLPLDAPDYAPAAQAVLAGFMTAHKILDYPVNIQIYPTDAVPEHAVTTYQQALLDGTQFVVGPLIRGEVESLTSGNLVTIPTLALNQPEGDAKLPERMLAYGLAVEAEARQAAQAIRKAGLQSVSILAADTPLAQRMARAFLQEWQLLEGGTARQINLPEDDKLPELKADITAQDAIFLATDATEAQKIRAYLDPALPTFGVSHIYDGNVNNSQNQALRAIHFIDMPWMLDSNNSDYAPYRPNATEFGKGWPQRWFALGADAYRLLPFITGTSPDKVLLHGLSGIISHSENGRFNRKLVMGQFRPEGVVLENTAP